MNINLYLLVAAVIIVLVGTLLMYSIESKLPDTKMKTILDAMWWCVATVTTVGYGDIVPVSGLGRAVGIVYMFFGISLISIVLSVINNNFYRKRIEKTANEEKEREMKYLRDFIISKLSEIEKKQSKCLELVSRKD